MADLVNILANVKGWAELCARVGTIPTFADAPIITLQIDLAGALWLQLRTFPIRTDGNYENEEPILVRFRCEGISELCLSGFASSAFIDELTISASGTGVRMIWESGFGVDGTVEASAITVDFSEEKRPDAV